MLAVASSVGLPLTSNTVTLLIVNKALGYAAADDEIDGFLLNGK